MDRTRRFPVRDFGTMSRASLRVSTPGETSASPHTSVRKAIILAAGTGDRLKPFTERMPKCLAPVNGVPILVNALTHLSDVGVTEAIVVVGHNREKIYEHVGHTFKDLKLTYVESLDYTTTNNIYSLWLAREHLDEDVFLLEADVFFDRDLLTRMLSHGPGSLAAVSYHQPWMSGTVVSVNKDGQIQALMDAREQGPDFDYSKVSKTVNIYLFRGEFLRRYFLPHLDAYIASEDVNEYYEVILYAMAHRGRHKLGAVQCDDLRWYEIDDESDRLSAEYLFSSPDGRYELVSGQHGGYWRYGFVDHAYLYNLYFPPEPVFAHFRNHLRDLVLNYPVVQGPLSRMVSTLVDQPEERVVVANGASELIKVLAGSVTRRMIIPVPTFNEYEQVMPEGKIVRFLLDDLTFRLDIDAFAAEAASCDASLAVVINPNNPTSLSVPRSNLCRLAEKLGQHGCVLVVDETFIDFCSDPAQASVANELTHHQNLVVLKSMSKAFGVGGLRLGYLLTANVEIAETVRRELPIWNVNGFSESFLRLAPRYRREFAESCVHVREDRDGLYERLTAIPGMTVFKPEANFVFCRLPDDAPSGPDIVRSLFVEQNILTKHCEGKGMRDSDRYLRIGSRTDPENQTLVDALTSIINAGS